MGKVEEEMTAELGRVEGFIECLWGIAEARADRRHNRKCLGEVAESAFLHKAMDLGLMVLKPCGDSARV